MFSGIFKIIRLLFVQSYAHFSNKYNYKNNTIEMHNLWL